MIIRPPRHQLQNLVIWGVLRTSAHSPYPWKTSVIWVKIASISFLSHFFILFETLWAYIEASRVIFAVLWIQIRLIHFSKTFRIKYNLFPHNSALIFDILSKKTYSTRMALQRAHNTKYQPHWNTRKKASFRRAIWTLSGKM